MIPPTILTRNPNINPDLGADDIAVYYGLIKTKDSDYQGYWQMLTEEERHHAQQLKNEQVHKRYVAVHGQLRKLLAQTLQQQPEKIIISKASHGKPYLADYPQLAFNISHSGTVFVIAIGWNCQLGIDIENYKMRPNLAALVKKCFAPEEAIYWQQLPDEQKTAEFYRFWTRKEAFVKATGFGIALGLQHCVINPEQPNAFLRIPNQCGSVTSWYLQDIDLPYSETINVYCALSTNKVITIATLKELT